MVRILWTGTGLDKISSWSELRVSVSVSTLNWVNGPLSPGSEGPWHERQWFILVKWSTTYTRKRRSRVLYSEMTKFGELTFGEVLARLPHPDTQQCLVQSSRDAWHQKHSYSFWTVYHVYTSWDIRYSISTSGYRPPSLIYYSFWRVGECSHQLYTVLRDLTNGGFPCIVRSKLHPVCNPPCWICVGVTYNFTTPKVPQ